MPHASSLTFSRGFTIVRNGVGFPLTVRNGGFCAIAKIILQHLMYFVSSLKGSAAASHYVRLTSDFDFPTVVALARQRRYRGPGSPLPSNNVELNGARRALPRFPSAGGGSSSLSLSRIPHAPYPRSLVATHLFTSLSFRQGRNHAPFVGLGSPVRNISFTGALRLVLLGSNSNPTPLHASPPFYQTTPMTSSLPSVHDSSAKFSISPAPFARPPFRVGPAVPPS